MTARRPTRAEVAEWDRRIASRRTQPKRTRRLTSLDRVLEAVEEGDAFDPTTPTAPRPPGRRTRLHQWAADTRVAVTVNGRPQVIDGTITAEQYRRQQAAPVADGPADQGDYRKALAPVGTSTPRRYERTEAWIIPASADDDGYDDPDDITLDFDQVEIDRDLARANADWDAAMAADERRCSHCDRLGIRAKGLCAACYEHQRSHRELPPIDGRAVRLRRWRDDAPVLPD